MNTVRKTKVHYLFVEAIFRVRIENNRFLSSLLFVKRGVYLHLWWIPNNLNSNINS